MVAEMTIFMCVGILFYVFVNVEKNDDDEKTRQNSRSVHSIRFSTPTMLFSIPFHYGLLWMELLYTLSINVYI